MYSADTFFDTVLAETQSQFRRGTNLSLLTPIALVCRMIIEVISEHVRTQRQQFCESAGEKRRR